MTNTQYMRWKDFALRAARTWYRNSRRPSAAWVEEQVAVFFDHLEDTPEDIPLIENWDRSRDYPPSEKDDFYWTPELEIHPPVAWRMEHLPPEADSTEGDDWQRHCRQLHGRVSYGVGDRFVMTFEDDIYDLDLDTYDKENGREIEAKAWEQYQDQWLGPVGCCIRAGLDLATELSMGVIGFTAGDIRAMYHPEGVPEWISNPGLKWQVCTTRPHPVGFMIEDTAVNGEFNEMPDDAALWL